MGGIIINKQSFSLFCYADDLAPGSGGNQLYAMALVPDRFHLSYEYACMWTIEWI